LHTGTLQRGSPGGLCLAHYLQPKNAGKSIPQLAISWRSNAEKMHPLVTCVWTRRAWPLGYSISHSVAFSQILIFVKLGVERANVSLCCLFRQKTPEAVACSMRGYFDFRSDSNELLNSLVISAVATQWLSITK
jgi:hypothetical protein